MSAQFDIGEVSPSKVFIAISAVLGLLFSFVADNEQPLFQAIIQWQIQTTGAVLIVLYSHQLLFAGVLSKNLIIKRLQSPWAKLILSGALGALLFSPIALLSDLYLGRDENSKFSLIGILDEFLAVAPPVCIAWVAMNAPWNLGYRLQSNAVTKSTEEALETQSQINKDTETVDGHQDEKNSLAEVPSFLSYTPFESAHEVDYLKSELHYISVVSADQKHLILYSLKDAISEMEAAGIDGFQVHRAYWVAKRAIKEFQKKERLGLITTQSGDEIPVSRTKVKTIKDALS